MDTLYSLAQLFQSVGTIIGRKKLQKIVHILQECGGADFGVPFTLCHYGAFSPPLAQELELLAENGFIETKPVNVSGYPSQEYSASAELMMLLTLQKQPVQPPAWQEMAKKLNSEGNQFLEALSTVIYLLRAGWDGKELNTQFSALKPHLKPQFEKAFQEAENLLSQAA